MHLWLGFKKWAVSKTCYTFCYPASVCHTASLSVSGPYFGYHTAQRALLDLPPKARHPYCPLCLVLEPAQTQQRGLFLWEFVLDMTALRFCSASQSQRTWLVKNVNQIGESQQSSSPPLFGSSPLPPGQGNRQSWGATTKPFPEPISCWTVCYTLSNIPKIILTSKAALIWPPPSFLPSLHRGARVSRTRVHLERLRCLWAELCSSWEGGRHLSGGEKKEKEKKVCGRPHLFSVAHCPSVGSSTPSRGEQTHQSGFTIQWAATVAANSSLFLLS